MTEIDIYDAPPAPAPPAPTLPVPPMNDFDSWTAVVVQVVRLAREICDTPFVPDGLRGSAPATAAAILAGREMGLGPMTSLQQIHVIKGKPGQSALLMRALIIAAGHQWEDIDVSDVRAVVRGRRKGESTWGEATFTAQQARTAGIELGKYPQDKLYARATVRLARRKFGDVILGMPYSAEELEDGDVDEGAIGADQPAAIEPPKPAASPPRTARRRTTPAAAAPDEKAPGGPAAAAGPAPQAAAADGLPPLPGEDEPDPTPPAAPAATSPATDSSTAPDADGRSEPSTPGDERHRKLVGIVHQHFKRLGFSDDDKAERLWAAGKIAAVKFDPDSLNDFDHDELSAIADTLAKCRDRKRLEEVLATAGEGGEPS
ncbi:MAG: hypothetical protein ACRDPY_15165 [Streptosporangiaceae bacterium]